MSSSSSSVTPPHAPTLLQLACFVAFFPCLILSQSDDALVQPLLLTSMPLQSIIAMQTVLAAWSTKTMFMLLAYVLMYLMIGAGFEWSHPEQAKQTRKGLVNRQIKLSVIALTINVIIISFYVTFVERFHPYFGYYDVHPHTLQSLLCSVLTYLFIFDAWFYWTHRLLHQRWWWKHVHWEHHEFVEPTAFAATAVHPFETVLQGTIGHLLPTLFFPIHPALLATLGMLSTIQALMAHDGRWDFMAHKRHHTHFHCNFSVYWPFWDIVCGTRYSLKTKANPIKHVD